MSSLFLVITNLIMSSVLCDVSHLNHVFFGDANALYKPPSYPIFTTTSQPFLPEIIVNRKIKEFGYSYQKPQNTYIPPIIVADPITPSEEVPSNQGYLPPYKDEQQQDIFVTNPKDDDLEKPLGYYYDQLTSTTPTNPVTFSNEESDSPEYTSNLNGYNYNTPEPSGVLYLPPSVTERSSKDLFNLQSKDSIRLQILEMRCILNQFGYFKSILKIDSFLTSSPIIENDLIDSRCDLHFHRSQVIVNILAEDFQRCGIVHCGNNNLCLKIRFPMIKGMKTAGDSILTLQCKVQDKIVTKTHKIKMGVTTNLLKGRNIGTFIQGGSQQPFRTHIELLRKTSGGLSKILDSNGVVLLGEDLQIKAQVHADDGWNFTRLSDVQLQRISSSGEILNSATLITPLGCVNPLMRAICPTPPIFEPPLGYRLSFKAVMFQGMKSGDEMLMIIKMIGCMNQYDCFINTTQCETNANGFSRLKRYVKENSTQYSDVSKISFRVAVPNTNPLPNSSIRNHYLTEWLIGGIIAFIVILTSLAIFVFLKFQR